MQLGNNGLEEDSGGGRGLLVRGEKRMVLGNRN